MRYHLLVALVALLVFAGCMVSPPSLMDDVDAVQAQIAHNMLQSGDWVTARLDGSGFGVQPDQLTAEEIRAELGGVSHSGRKPG